MRYGSLFAGIGGFDLGFDQVGMKCAFQVEIDDACSRVLRRHWPDVERFGDIRDVSGDDVCGVDLLCGGFPCQDVSIAGARGGLDSARSGLFFEFMRLCGELGPTWVVIENVPGLLSSNGGKDMGTVLGTLGDLGYGYAWRILDSQHFGVPQRRRRIFIVGNIGDWAAPAKVLLEPEGVPRDSGAGRAARQEVAGTLTARTDGGGFPGSDEAMSGYVQPVSALTTRCSNVQDDQQIKQLVPFRKSRRAQNVKDPETWVEDDVSNTLNVFDVGEIRSTQLIGTFSLYPETGQGADLKARETSVAPALTTTDGDVHDRGTRVVDELGVRRLSPRECERLQGFPDNWTAGQADTPRYKQLGNAVTVNVARWIGKRIMEKS